MNFDVKEIATITMVLFAVIDVVGSLPLLIDIKTKVGKIHSEKATLVSGAIMIAFLFVGQSILDLIGVDLSSFAIAGSFILFLLALEMILGVKFYKHEDSSTTASIVPIAFPILAGAGTMTTLLSIRAQYHIENILISIFLNLIFIYITLKNMYRIEKVLGPGGINVLRKVFGVILLAIAIKLFRSNLGV